MQNKTLLLLILSVFTIVCQSQTVQHRFIAAGSGMKDIVIVDENWIIEWTYPGGKECNDVSLLSNDTVLFSCRTGAKMVSLDKEILWHYEAEPNTEVQSASMLENGNILIIQNGNPALLKEIDLNGVVQKTLTIPTTLTKIHAQFRNIRKTKEGTYLVGYHKENKVCEFDKDGKVIRTIDTGTNVFSAVRLPNGNILIPCGDSHRLIEVDENDNEVWTLEENEIPGHPLRFVANAHRLPNGNTVVCNWGGHGYKTKQPQVFEITRDKKIVWEVNDWVKFNSIATIQILDVDGESYR